MYTAKPTKKFQKELKAAEKRGYDISKLTAVIKMLSAGENLPQKHNDHALKGKFIGCRECQARLAACL